MPRCFYCDHPLTESKRWDQQGPRPANKRTTEHIFPQYASRVMACLFSAEWRELNRVDACPSCNERKGNMSPLRWLSYLLDAAARDRLQARLAALGVSAEALASALAAPPPDDTGDKQAQDTQGHDLLPMFPTHI